MPKRIEKMYFVFGILIIAGIFFSVFYYRQKRIICEIRAMCSCEKYCRLNEIIQPWGFSYLPSRDILTSALDAWQREFGYHALFDKTAPYFNKVFDCEPVYFDYQGRTWMIELWKGQYGINTGGEIGVYCADSILLPEQYEKAHFHSVEDEQMLFMSMELYEKGCSLFQVQQCHWWLTGFCMGKYSEPENLEMKVSVTCPDQEMVRSFTGGLLSAGYKRCELEVCGEKVTFGFSVPRGGYRAGAGRFRACLSQWKNRLFCKLYCRITSPFCCTLDRLLYLYLLIPFAFRHMLCFKRNGRQKICREGRVRR